MKYILTLEKFKTSIIGKIENLMKGDTQFKNKFIKLMNDYDIQIDKITDDYFDYLPTNKVFRKPNKKETPNVVTTRHTNPRSDGGIPGIERFKVGDTWLDIDGDKSKITKIGDKRIGDNGEYRWTIHSRRFGDWCDIIKYEEGDVFWEQLSPDERVEEGGYTTILGNDFRWMPYLKEKVSEDEGKKIIPKYSGFFKDTKSSGSIYPGKSPHYLFFWFNIENELLAYTRADDNGEPVNMGFGSNDKIKASDYVIIFDLKKAVKELSGISDIRHKRSERKSGAIALMSNEDIKKMNIERFKNIIIDRYVDINPNDIENYTNYKKLLQRVFSNNPLAIIMMNSPLSKLETYKDSLMDLAKSVSKGDSEEYIKEGIKNIKSSIRDILDMNIVRTKIDWTFTSGNDQDMYDPDEYPERRDRWVSKIYPHLKEIQDLIRDRVLNREYNSLMDLEFLIFRLNQVKEYAKSGRFPINYYIKSIRNTHGNPGYTNIKSGFSYYFDEYLYNNDNEYLKKEIRGFKSLKNMIKSNL